MKSQQQRQAEKRQEKLDLIEQQIKDGTLVVRKMTAAERKQFNPVRKTTAAERKAFRPASRARAGRKRGAKRS